MLFSRQWSSVKAEFSSVPIIQIVFILVLANDWQRHVNKDISLWNRQGPMQSLSVSVTKHNNLKEELILVHDFRDLSLWSAGQCSVACGKSEWDHSRWACGRKTCCILAGLQVLTWLGLWRNEKKTNIWTQKSWGQVIWSLWEEPTAPWKLNLYLTYKSTGEQALW